MLHFLKPASLLLLAVGALSTSVSGQGLDPLNPIPGGATGANVVCLQTGDLNSGALLVF